MIAANPRLEEGCQSILRAITSNMSRSYFYYASDILSEAHPPKRRHAGTCGQAGPDRGPAGEATQWLHFILAAANLQPGGCR